MIVTELNELRLKNRVKSILSENVTPEMQNDEIVVENEQISPWQRLKQGLNKTRANL